MLEKSTYMGGISRTVNYKGNRIDIGGAPLLLQVRPGHELVAADSCRCDASGRGPRKSPISSSTATIAAGRRLGTRCRPPMTVMLVRKRKSRIYFLRQFFEYPIQR